MDNQDNAPKGNELQIELNEEVAEGTYSNLAIINHSNTEFVLDFVRVMPGIPKAKVQSRIILTAHHAKRLLMALGENISRYEEAFGEIEINDQQNSPIPMNFGGPTGEA